VEPRKNLSPTFIIAEIGEDRGTETSEKDREGAFLTKGQRAREGSGMTDGKQEATQEPEPITPDNNFPKAFLPSSRAGSLVFTARARTRASIFLHTIGELPPAIGVRIRKFTTSIAISPGCSADRATGGTRRNERGLSGAVYTYELAIFIEISCIRFPLYFEIGDRWLMSARLINNTEI